MPAPSHDTAILLREAVAAWRQAVVAIRTQPGFAGLSVTSVAANESRVQGSRIRDRLEQVLAGDVHLRAACRSAFQLGLALDVLLLDSIGELEQLARGDALDERITQVLLDRLFESDYRRRLHFRLYNLVVDAPAVEFPAPVTARIELVAPEHIPAITGETTPGSTLHRIGTGDAFLVFEDSGGGDLDDIAWWEECARRAQAVLWALRYLKYAIVDLDYAGLHHTPEWVNEVRRYGIGIGGRPRLDVQHEPYRLSGADQTTLLRYLAAMTRFEGVLTDMRPSLRRSLLTAGDYYEGHHSRTTQTDRLVDLVIALEALFGTGQELGYRIPLTAAVLLADGADRTEELIQFIRTMYSARNRLVHGGDNPFSAGGNESIGQEELDRLGDLVRQAVLRCGVLLARGDFDRDRSRFLRALARAVYDHGLRTQIRQRSDVDMFLTEQGL